MTLCKNILTFAANFSYPLLSNEFLSFSENSTFDFMIRFCFTRLWCTPSVEPQSAKFSAHSHANDFANPANPVLTPWFIFYCSNDGARGAGGGGGGSKFNRVFLHRWTHPNLYFPTLFITLQQKVHSRRWRSPWVKTKYTACPHKYSNEILADPYRTSS